jgi:hypothetical protein
MALYSAPNERPITWAVAVPPRKESDQLVLEDPRALAQCLSFVSERPTSMPSETLMPPMCPSFGNSIMSPGMYNHIFDPQFNAAHAERSFIFPCRETATSAIILTPGAFVPSSPSIGPTSQPCGPPMWGTPESESKLTNEESDPTRDALPLHKLEHGVWKCMLCGQELRRKQRAIVHYWSKHGNVRLSCSGRCGLKNW